MVKTRKNAAVAVLIGLVILATVFLGIGLFLRDRAESPEEIRDKKLAELELRSGEYDEYSIVINDTSVSEATALAEKIGAELRITADGSFATLTLTDGRTINDIYKDESYLKYVELLSADWQATVSRYHGDDATNKLPSAPTDSKNYQTELQEYLDQLNMSTVWNTTTGANVTVAIIDTGIDTDHPEFSGRISEWSYNATEDKIVKDHLLDDGSYDWSLIEDEIGHGTAVAGALAASMDGAGMVGVAPSVNVIVIKAECAQNGTFKRTSDLVFGLYYAIEHNAAVVNMSFGSYSNSNYFSEATRLAYDSDVICVAAAGNDSTAALAYPAADENVIGVGALADGSWELASYSNYGENVDAVAPGTVYTTTLGGEYRSQTGTSLASPLVAGAVALLVSTDKYATFDKVYELVIASSYDLGELGHDYYYGYGAIDVSALVIEKRGTITYDMMTDELDDAEGTFIIGHTLQKTLTPQRLYAIFDGWYYDPYYTEEYVWYDDAVYTDITVYAKWANEDDGIPFTYVELEDGTVEIRSYTGSRRYITIPEYIDGKLVTSIGELAFSGQSSLREIYLPSGLKHIGRYAFKDCSSLMSMTVPAGVVEIEEGAFYNDIRTSAIVFESGSSLKSIGDYAFAYCSGISTIELPSGVTYIGKGAFLGDISLVKLGVQQGNEKFVSLNGVLFNSTGSTLVAYPAAITSEYTVPSETVTVEAYAFAYSHIEKIELNEISYIGEHAFEHSNIRSVELSKNVKSVGEYAFSGCAYLSSVIFEADSGIRSISKEMFSYCARLETITLPESVEAIGENAFNASSLRKVEFGENSVITNIGDGAFKNTLIDSIVLPRSLNTIGNSAFYKCVRLSEVSFEENSNIRIIGAYAFYGTDSLVNTVFPDTVTQIGDFSFAYSGLSGAVNIPSALTYIGEGAFAACHNLENFNVSEDNLGYCSADGVVYTKDGKKLVVYPAGNSRTKYVIPDGTGNVSAAAFYGADRLTALVLPNSLTYIEEYAFAYMTSLGSMSIPDNVIQIGRYAFIYDSAISTVTFSENCVLPRIGFGAFAYSGIRSITIPQNVSTIAQNAFAGCTRLASVTFAKNSKLSSVSAYMFEGAINLKTIKFENGSALTSIQAHGFEGMSKLTSVDLGDAELTSIGNFAFRFCEGLTSFSVTNGVESIGRYAFYGCYALKSVSIPESVEHIGAYAFLQTGGALEVYFASEILPAYLDEDWDRGVKSYYTGVISVKTNSEYKYATLKNGGIAILEYFGSDTILNLENLELGGDIITVGGGAFAYSTVESITLPDTLITIQRGAFYHSALKSVTFPASVEFIGTEAFADTPLVVIAFQNGSALKVIEQSAFEGTKKLSAPVLIPASVTTLGRAIFRNSSVRSVEFEKGTAITELPIEMFYGSSIEAFAVPDSVTKLCDGVFEGASELKSVTYGDALTWLGARAFYRSGLTSFHIKKNLTVIEEFALVSLEELTSFTIDESNPCYTVENGLLLSKDRSKLITVPAGLKGSLTVPLSVEKIGYGAFEASKLDEVLFNDEANLLSIGYRAFFGAEKLASVNIPSSVIAIDYYAFAYSEELEKVTFDEGSALKGVYEGAFYGCISLSDILLPDSIVEISDYAFCGCTKLTSLPISDTSEIKGIYSYAFAYTNITDLAVPESVIDIGDHAFLGNSSLVSVTVPATEAKELIIGLGAFEDCVALKEITLPFIGASYEDNEITWFGYIFGAGAYKANSAYVPTSLEKVIINSDITFIGSYAFYKLGDIKSIDVPESVTAVYKYAFCDTTAKYGLESEIKVFEVSGKRATSISEDYFGKGITNLKLAEGVTSIGTYAFKDCIGLTSIAIPKSLTSVRGWTFQGCDKLARVYISDIAAWCAIYFKYADSNPLYYAKNLYLNGSLVTELVIPEGVTSIGSYAFENCSSLTSINIPDSVTSIGSSAFYNCSSLTSVNIPYGVESIGNSAFSYCSSLASVTIGNSVTSIGSHAFSECSSLTSVTIPDSVTSIGSSAFSYCSGLTSVTIPDSVTSIGSSAFYNCSSLTSVNIPYGVESIGNSAFSYCSSLASVTIGNSVTSIGSHAFSECSSLTSVTIPDSVTSIGSSAFSYCSSLASVTIGNSVTGIGDFAFYECKKLASLTLPNSLTYISSGSFSYCSSLTSVTIPDSVTSIESKAFQGCAKLRSITIPENVTSIGEWAFASCGLLSVTIPQGITGIETLTFAYCNSLISVTIPNSVKNIGSEAFYWCHKLKNVCNNSDIRLTIGSSDNGYLAYYANVIEDKDGNKTYKTEGSDIIYIDTADGFMFKCENGVYKLIAYLGNEDTVTLPKDINGCSYEIYSMQGVKNVIIPEGVTSIGECAFSGCTTLESVIIPNSVTSIGRNAFYQCYKLANITIPNSVTSIGSYAFEYCKSLTSINIPYGVESIGRGAFSGCSNLASVTIPDSVTSMGWSVFYECSSLESVTVPSSVTSFGIHVFEKCSNLTNVVFCGGVPSIGEMTFAYCSNLKSVTIPDSVTSIGVSAFHGCSSLTSITIPDSVSRISGGAFNGCTSLESITIPSNAYVNWSAFSTCNAVINIAEGSSRYTAIDGVVYNKNKKTIIWVPRNITEIIIPEGVEIIGEAAFSGCGSLTSVTIPESVTKIDYSAFRDCSSLESVTIPDSVTGIGSYAFYGCSSLMSIAIPDSVMGIGAYAFQGCSSLTSVKLSESITIIGRDTFLDCEKLTSIRVPEGVTSIESYAFWGCSSLESIYIPDSVKSVGDRVFLWCSNLKSVNISDIDAWCAISFEDSYYSTPLYYDARLYLNGSLVTEVIIPDGITSCNAFSGYAALTSITIPGSVTGIAGYAFYGCSCLKSIIIPESVTYIGHNAFNGCSGLTSIIVPDSVKSIGYQAFFGCSNLTSLTIGSGLTSIEGSVFRECDNLTGVSISDIAAWCAISFSSYSSNPLYYAKNLYLNGELVTDLVIPEGVTNIGESAFCLCSSLTSVTIPDSVTSIGRRAFMNCRNLTSIAMGTGVTRIEEYAFYGCTDLTSIVIPTGVTSIGNSAFYNCDRLLSVTIPDSIMYIEAEAFYGCDDLEFIYNNSDIELTLGSKDNGYLAYYAKLIVDKESNKIYDTNGSDLIYIDTADGFMFTYENGVYKLIAYLGTEDTVTLPKDINGCSYEIYKMRGVSNVIVPEGVTSIGDHAFEYCRSLASITILDSVTSIGSSAFEYCSSLTSVTIPEGVTSIGKYAFYGCSNLTDVTIGNGVKKIKENTFGGCSKLVSITIPNSVTSIENYAFSCCKSLKSITIPDGVTSIEIKTFNGCTSLASITVPNSVKSIGRTAFNDTAYYKDQKNWKNGALYIGDHLYAVDPTVAIFAVPEGAILSNSAVFSGCYRLKHLTIGGNHSGILSDLTNLVTLVITDIPQNHNICGYFGSASKIPTTLENIVLAEGATMRSKLFAGIEGVTVYVGDNEKDVRWDTNYPGWSNENKAVYGNDWITVSFCDQNGNIYSSEIYLTSQVIRIPVMELERGEEYRYVTEGWDLDGDGRPDTFPATSPVDVFARLVISKVVNEYTVTFYDNDGLTVIYTERLPYGSEIVLPEAPEKRGYTFVGWSGFTAGMTVKGDIGFVAEWTHDGNGHIYGEPEQIAPTCTECGYCKYTCTVCGEWYATDYTLPIGHKFVTVNRRPDCENDGYDLHTCSVCGYSYKDNPVGAIGHNYGEWYVEVEAGCTKYGSKYRECVCGGREYEVIEPVGHRYASNVTRKATCSSVGKITYSCACGDTVVEDIPKTEHDYEKVYVNEDFLQWLIRIILNLFFGYDNGEPYYYKCTECGHVATSGEIDITYNSSVSTMSKCEHRLGEWESLSSSACAECEIEGRRCSVCGETVEYREVTEKIASGKCGKAMRWTLYGNGTLMISGNGEMNGYSKMTMPWYVYASQIKKVVVSEGVTSIGKSAFNNEKAGFVFTEIDLPSTLTSIGNYAFYGCKSLDKVTIPASVNSIGKYAFRKSGVVDLSFEGANGWCVGSEGKFSFANKTVALNALVYRHYDKVWTATAEGDTTVNIIAVDRCGKNVNWMLSDDGVLTVTGSGVMYDFGAKNAPWAGYKAQIKSVVIGEGVTSIGNCAFYECANITSISLPSTLTGIGNYAFYGCKALTEITVPASVNTIGAYAFRKCNSLATATFENADGWSYGNSSATISAEAIKANYKNAWTRA